MQRAGASVVPQPVQTDRQVVQTLRHNGVVVRMGQQVSVGETIGFSGNTGYTTTPHLHFNVVAVDDALDWVALDIRFDNGSSPGFVPVSGQWVSTPESIPASRSPSD